MIKIDKAIFKRSDVVGKKPTAEQLDYGEIAINYAKNSEAIFFKNNENHIVEIKAQDKLIEVTYAQLKTLRDGKKLVPGQLYRITDFVTTSTQTDTRSAGHPFDIIVVADDEGTLNENAHACLHTGDTYFAGCKLDAWELKYSLDNDTNKFAWADTTNGKGVVWWMKDEWNNECFYDFKNIQFKYPKNDTTYPYYYYTFASSNVEDNTDYSLNISNKCYSNVIKEYVKTNKRALNQIIFIGSDCYSNTFGSNCYNNSFGNNCQYNTFGNNCARNTFGNNCQYNTFGNNCGYNTFGNECGYNTFGNDCQHNTFGNNFQYNIFGNRFYEGTFGNNCWGNSFGNDCWDNSFGNNCWDNSFGNNCGYNTFGNNCARNTFGNECRKIKLPAEYSYYQNNHFGDGCQYILFKGVETASSAVQVQNYNFAQGLQGTSDAYLTINGVRNRNFETKVEKDSNGNLKTFCLADIIYSEEDNPEPSYPYSTSFIGEI